jgi:hypothetical protein
MSRGFNLSHAILMKNKPAEKDDPLRLVFEMSQKDNRLTK